MIFGIGVNNTFVAKFMTILDFGALKLQELYGEKTGFLPNASSCFFWFCQ